MIPTKKDLNIVFMGTPDFAVAPLDALLKNGYNISAVITSPDKQAGRGLKQSMSSVKKFTLEHNLHILQPTNLKAPEFIEELKAFNPDLQIVVAFRMLPELIWKLPPFGTFNLHASLLPQYRGAAPINWAIMNGETETGVTTFFINENIDTGNIIMAEKVEILPAESAGELHDKLMDCGAKLIIKTVNAILENNINVVSQDVITSSNTNLKLAPKLFKEDCRINWNNNADKVFNHIRGLSPYPAAYTDLISPEGDSYYTKIFRCSKEITRHHFSTGQIITDSNTHLSIAVIDGLIHLQELQISSKKKMPVSEFLRGFRINNDWKTNLA